MSRIRVTRSSNDIPAASAAGGESGDRVGLQHPRSVLGEDQVDPGEALAAERPAGGERRVGHGGALDGGEVGGADEVGASDLVAGLEVVAVAFGRDRLDDRQGLGAEDADRELAPPGVALQHHAVVVEEAATRAPGAAAAGPARGGGPGARGRPSG